MASKVDNGPILDALKKYLHLGTDKELSELLNIKKSSLSSWRNNACRINTAIVINAVPEIRMEWLLTGQEPMLRPGYAPDDTPITIKEEDITLPNKEDDVRIASLKQENDKLREEVGQLRQQNATLQKAIDLISRMS